MFRLSTRRTTLALTLAAVTGLCVPAAQAGDDKDDRRSRDDHRQKDGRGGWDRKDRGRNDHGRDDHHRDDHHRDDHRGGHTIGGITIRIGTPPVIVRERVVVSRPAPVVISQPCDVMPENLSVTAYQTQDRVIVLITGSNRSAGYTTCLTEVDTSCEIPTLTMRNTAPTRSSAHCMTGFNLNAAVRSRETLCTIRLLVAGQTVEVPVTQVPSLS